MSNQTGFRFLSRAGNPYCILCGVEMLGRYARNMHCYACVEDMRTPAELDALRQDSMRHSAAVDLQSWWAIGPAMHAKKLAEYKFSKDLPNENIAAITANRAPR